MMTTMDILKPWKWRTIYRVNKQMRQLGQLIVLRKKYQVMMEKALTPVLRRQFSAKHKEVNMVINARMSAFTFK